MTIEELKEKFGLNDHDTTIIETVINELDEITDLDDKMDFLNESTFYLDLDNKSIVDELMDELKELV